MTEAEKRTRTTKTNTADSPQKQTGWETSSFTATTRTASMKAAKTLMEKKQPSHTMQTQEPEQPYIKTARQVTSSTMRPAV